MRFRQPVAQFEQQALSEHVVIEAAAFDAGERVERTLRLDEVEAHLRALRWPSLSVLIEVAPELLAIVLLVVTALGVADPAQAGDEGDVGVDLFGAA